MKLANYRPTSRQVLFQEVSIEKVTTGGVILPKSGFSIKTHSDMFENEREHVVETPADLVVIKVGDNLSTDLQPGDKLVLSPGAASAVIELDTENGTEKFHSIPEHFIVGWCREET